MRDPLQRLKYLPWLELVLTAALTTLVVTALDIVLSQIILIVVSRPSAFFGTLTGLSIFASAVGIGALAVYIMERFFRQVYINAATLWALTFCLLALLFIKTRLPLPIFLTGFGYTQFIGIILGASWKGRRYWR